MKALKMIGKSVLILLAAVIALVIIAYLLLLGSGGSYYNEDGSYKMYFNGKFWDPVS